MTTTPDTSNREIITTRTVNAPRELVWKVWTNPEHVKHWWGPNGFTNTIEEMEVKPGGVWRFMMHGPDGVDYPNKIVFKEVKEPELLSYSHGTGEENDENGFETTVHFEQAQDKTIVTMKAVLRSAEELERVIKEVGAIEGGKQTLEKLEQYLDKEQKPFVIERMYDAPVDKIWLALTDAAEMKKWYFDIADFKAEPGFEFSFIGQGLKGEKYVHLCTITDTIPGKKLRYSWRYENFPGISFVSFELFPEGNKTKLKLTHEGLETFPDSPDFAKKNFEQGWTEITGTSLKNYLEGLEKAGQIIP